MVRRVVPVPVALGRQGRSTAIVTITQPLRLCRLARAKSGVNPALSRNCEAPFGDEPGRLLAGRRLALGGGVTPLSRLLH